MKNTIISFIKLLFILILSFNLFCNKLPESPIHDSPIDPDNPTTGGDPFQLSAQIANGGVTLTKERLLLLVGKGT